MNWLGKLRILDPACGSGNFLYVSLNELHRLEREVIRWGFEHGVKTLEPKVHPRQLLGIELDEYAHQLASVVVWIGHIQNQIRVGVNIGAHEPILEPLDTIECRDAIVDATNDTPQTAEWPETDFIVGNPPFLGNKYMRLRLGNDAVDRIYRAWDGRVPNGADICAYWFEKAREQIADGRTKRAGLLATQSIRGGRSRIVLQRIRESGGILFAVSDRNWSLDGSTVHISMVGFDDGAEAELIRDGEQVDVIYADLTSNNGDVTFARKLPERKGQSFQGVNRVGPFDIPHTIAYQMLKLANPHAKPNSDVVKPFLNGRDVADVSRQRWIIDFGVDTPEAEAALYDAPFHYLEKYVKPARIAQKHPTNRPWWLHQGLAIRMRQAIAGLERFIVTPRVGKFRVFQWVKQPTVPDGALVVFARDDDYFFGVLHSRAHRVWALSTGTQLRERESGFRYTPTTCFETFPFPRPTDEQRQSIADAAKTLVKHRDNWLNPSGTLMEESRDARTLTNLYNTYPRWLANDHARLDAAVNHAYGWTEAPDNLEDNEICERLLQLNLVSQPS